jgi:hypothetical protein
MAPLDEEFIPFEIFGVTLYLDLKSKCTRNKVGNNRRSNRRNSYEDV